MLFRLLFFTMVVSLQFMQSGIAFAQDPENPLSPDARKISSEEKEIDGTKKEQEKARAAKVFDAINERNRTLKKSPEWLKEAYGGLKIKKLNDIPRGEYKSYAQYLLNKEIYIIVHPGYYAFFDALAIVLPDKKPEGLPDENIFERLYQSISPTIFNLQIMKEQEKLLRDFIEFMSIEKKLVILILPKDYKKNSRYIGTGLDEYARYINDISNMSESVIYMESRASDSGYMEKSDMTVLGDFIEELGARRIVYSGGYIGRCLDNFYTSLFDKFSISETYSTASVSGKTLPVSFIPDLASIAPDEIDAGAHAYLLTQDGRINPKGVLNYFVKRGAERVLFPKIRRFNMYSLYR